MNRKNYRRNKKKKQVKKDIDTANTQGRNTSQAKEWRQRDEEPITGRGEEGHF